MQHYFLKCYRFDFTLEINNPIIVIIVIIVIIKPIKHTTLFQLL